MLSNGNDHPVMVGVDYSDSVRAAVEFAADIGAGWNAPVDLVHVAARGSRAASSIPVWLGRLGVEVWRAGATPGAVEVVTGTPVGVLAERSAQARLLVLGSYGTGARPGALAGSVALELLERALCPVAVVRGAVAQAAPRRHGPIVVGVDGSAAGRAALVMGAGIAASLGTGLLGVHVWSDAQADGRGRAGGDGRSAAEQAADLLRAELGSVELAGYPLLHCDHALVEGTPANALLRLGQAARMLIVGHDGRNERSIGSTARALVEFAPCPVVVARPEAVVHVIPAMQDVIAAPQPAVSLVAPDCGSNGTVSRAGARLG